MATPEQTDIVSQMEATAQTAWDQSSLGSEYASDFLDHTATKDQSGIFYCPRVFRPTGENIIWRLAEVIIRRPGHSFSIPGNLLSGIFLDTTQNKIYVAFKDVDSFYADGTTSQLPYDRYSIRDGSTQFAITYRNLASGKPLIINDSVLQKVLPAK